MATHRHNHKTCARKPAGYLRCHCGGTDFHYDYERNTYTCRACRAMVRGCTLKRKT